MNASPASADHVAETAEPIGFIGIGVMGTPMALNLLKAGIPIIVWNRSPEKCEPLRKAGAEVAATPDALFARASTVLMMLIDEAATNAVLDRGTPEFAAKVAGRLLVNMGSVPPAWSRALAQDVRTAGGRFVEAPVSGSRKPAEAGQLVGLVAGEREDMTRVTDLLKPLCRETIQCGAIGKALLMKLALNQFLLAMTVGLAEAVHFAERNDLDLAAFKTAVDAGPMASNVSRLRSAKLIERDFERQTSVDDAWNSARLVTNAARDTATASPLADACRTLLGEASELGHGQLDMAAVLCALEARSGSGKN
ncbi:MAG: NAD(P)-dependent oxidoreductase [Pseudomonadota bacterium]